jgi:hypothetical protein
MLFSRFRDAFDRPVLRAFLVAFSTKVATGRMLQIVRRLGGEEKGMEEGLGIEV